MNPIAKSGSGVVFTIILSTLAGMLIIALQGLEILLVVGGVCIVLLSIFSSVSVLLIVLIFATLIPYFIPLTQSGIGFSGIRLLTTDCLFLVAIIPWLCRALIAKKRPVPIGKVTIPLLGFLGMAFFAVLQSTRMGIGFDVWIKELRPIVYLTICFVVASELRTLRQLKLSVKVFIFGVTLLALKSFYLRMMSVETAADVNLVEIQDGFVRVLKCFEVHFFVVGILILVSLILFSLSRRNKAFYVLLASFIGTALLFTYTRIGYISLIAGLFVVFLGAGIRKAFKVTVASVAVIILSLLAGEIVQIFQVAQTSGRSLTSSVAQRLWSSTNIKHGDAIQYRFDEWRQVERKVLGNLLVGSGLGAAHSPVYTKSKSIEADFTSRFVHNSYLYLLLKMGIVGLIVFIVLLASYGRQCWMLFRRLKNPYLKAVSLALLAGIVAVIIQGLTGFIFDYRIMLWLGLCFGLPTAIKRMTRTSEDPLTLGNRNLGRPNSGK
jgi:O-antigen ligase